MLGQINRLICSALMLFGLAVSASSGNRFNVVTYHDPMGAISNNDSFYVWLDQFGASRFYANDTVAAHYLGLFDSIPIQLFGGHSWRSHTRTWLNYDSAVDSPTIEMDQAAGTFTTYTVFDAPNIDPGIGYEHKVDSAVGQNTIDQLRTARRAIPNTHLQGFLYAGLNRGHFRFLGKVTPPAHELDLVATLRLPDTSGNKSQVVAQLIFEDMQYAGPCDLSDNQYAIQRVNNDWLRVGDTLLRPADTLWPGSLAKWTKLHFCNSTTGSDSVDTRSLRNLCYRVPGETTMVCAIPYRFVLDITVGDFPSNTQYVDIRMPVVVNGIDWAQHNYKLYWTGVRELYLDELRLVDPRGEWLHALAVDSAATAAERIQDKFDEMPVMRRIDHFYMFDEPTGTSLSIAEFYKRIVDALPSNGLYPKHQMATLGSYDSPSSSHYGHHYFDTWMHYAEDPAVNFFMFDNYINFCCLSSSSEVYDSTYMQFHVDGSVIPQLTAARMRADSISTDPGFWVVLPTFSWHDCTSKDSFGRCIQWKKTGRAHTPTELKMLINLSLSYGATGIGYWKYTSEYLTCPGVGADAQTPRDRIPELSSSGDTLAGYVSLTSALYDCTACTTFSCPTPPPYRNECPIAIVNGAAMKTETWDSLRVMNMYMDSMATFFLNGDWLSSGNTDHGPSISSLAGSFIDSLKSSRFAHPYIQVGFFDGASTPYGPGTYAYIVNRRCDDGSFGQVDSQTVAVYMAGEGVFEVYDVYADTSYRIWDSAGVLKWTHQFQPGEAALVRLDPVRQTWSGTPDTTSWQWQWPAGATINLSGDITISQGMTYSIGGTTLKALSNVDSTSGGTDATKTEIVVNGVLRVAPAGGVRPVFCSTTGADSTWYGIRLTSTGKAVLDNAVIKHAWKGVDMPYGHERPDTIKNSRFENCYVSGVTCWSDSAYFVNDTFYNMPNYGIDFEAATNTHVTDCHFEEVGYPLYCSGYKGTISGCSFVEQDIVGYPFSGGNPAIYFELSGTGTLVDECTFNNTNKGIRVGPLSNLSVTDSKFYSDSIYSSIYPFMYVGIYDEDGWSANTLVRHCCFHDVNHAFVYRTDLTCNLGTSSDSGFNSFRPDSVYYPDSSKTIKWPKYHVANYGSGSVSARGNFYYRGSGFYGSVDSSNIVAGVVDGCQPPAGGGAKRQVDPQEPIAQLPRVFAVHQNYPNPFNPSTQISFDLPTTAQVEVEVFNILGQRISTIFQGRLEAGQHVVEWSGTDSKGRYVGSGVYLYRVSADGVVESRKMLLIR